MRPKPDMQDPRFRSARVREVRPVVATTRETLAEYLARGGAVKIGDPDPRIIIPPLRVWRESDLSAMQHGWTWIQPLSPAR